MTAVRPRGRMLRRLWWRVEARMRRLFPWRRQDSVPRLVFVFDYDSMSPEAPPSAVAFRELSIEEIRGGRYRVGEAPPAPTDVETGCVVGIIEGRQVYHAWYIRSDSARMQGLPASWRGSGPILFLHDGTTEPAFRGRGIHSAATRWLLRREQGGRTKHAVCIVDATNRAAQQAVRRAGFRVVGEVD